MKHRRTVALTGGTGFAGPSIARALLAAGHEVRALCRPGREHRLPSGCAVVGGSLEQTPALEGLVRGCDVVVHAASAMATMDTSLLERINVVATQALVEAAENAGVGRIVLISSIAARRSDDGPYSRSKLDQEEAVRRGGVPWVVLQPPLIVGQGSQVEEAVLGLTARLPMLPVIASRSPLHPIGVDDLGRVVAAAVTAEEVEGHTFQLGGNEPLSFPDLARRVLRVHGRRALFVPLPVRVARPVAAVLERLLPSPPLTGEAVSAIDSGTPIDLEPARVLLGFEPSSLEEALRQG